MFFRYRTRCVQLYVRLPSWNEENYYSNTLRHTSVMRLLNTETFKLEELLGDKKQRYAILSHTWGKEEVLFADMKDFDCNS
jgi:hypothetical protein